MAAGGGGGRRVRALAACGGGGGSPSAARYRQSLNALCAAGCEASARQAIAADKADEAAAADG